MKNKTEFEPYQLFFFSGLLISLMGLGIWLFFQMGWLSFYPIQEHAVLMILGFLLAYISGFLMTAVPKMSQTQSAHNSEIAAGLFLLWLQVALVFKGSLQLNYLIGILQLSVLVFFVGHRILKRRANPPMGFVFLPFGLGAGLIGCALYALPPGTLSEGWSTLAKNLLYQGFVLNLILGLGTRLIPALTRVQGALDVRAAVPEKISHYLVLAFLFNSTFFVEAFVSSSLGQILKFAFISWMAVQKFKILKDRQVKSHLGTGLRFSVYFLALGFLAAGVFPNYAIHFLHLSYIGGFALLTLLISTRVVLAHGGYNLSMEVESPHLVFFFSVAGFIALARASIGFGGSARPAIIWVLCIAWLLMLTVWSRFYLAKLWKAQPIHSKQG